MRQKICCPAQQKRRHADERVSWHGAILHSAVLSCVLIRSNLSLLSNCRFLASVVLRQGGNWTQQVSKCGLAEILACTGFLSDSKQHANTFPHTLHFISTPSNMSQREVCYVSRAKKQHFAR